MATIGSSFLRSESDGRVEEALSELGWQGRKTQGQQDELC